jgi:YesN/AraC family two-component response regulator
LQKIREGNPDYKEAFNMSRTLSSGVKFDSGNPLRNAKNNMLVLLTLSSRAAIEGGLSPTISYTMQDYYTQRVEDAASISEISVLGETILEDYVRRVGLCRANGNKSKWIQSCCDYITAHITEGLSISLLASRAGYTEYYFSRKFKQEMGCSIGEFIKQERIRRAQILLSSTNLSIIDICNELCFNSRSFFSDTFQKVTGESPAEYRRKHLKT